MIPRSVPLQKIIDDLPGAQPPGVSPALRVSGIAIDSRRLKPGDLFVALPGHRADGHAFIQEAVHRGASAVIGEQSAGSLPVPYIRLPDTRRALTWISAAFYDWPGRKLTVIGVTGTDGKTTTVSLIHRILLTASKRAGMISTVSAVVGDDTLDTGFHVTTPDAQDLQRFLARMVEAGMTHAVLETTSHGWAQHRVDACEFDVGVITNITHEHLDEHGSFENYRAAKARLLESLARTLPKPHGNPRLGVINRDDPSHDFLRSVATTRTLSYGLSEQADVRAEEMTYSASGIAFEVAGPGLQVALSSPLLGAHNVSNCLAAITATVCGLQVAADDARQGISAMPGIPGRMEQIHLGQDYTAIVDFAHTPNALRVTLATARQLLGGQGKEGPRRAAPGRVIVIIGSAGLRDRQKRHMMAEIAVSMADLAILTAEDPRTESLDAILAEMAAGAISAGGKERETFWRIPDRGEAIRFAVNLARAGDIVLTCGKGHEQSMCFGEREHSWDDRTAMRAALAERLGTDGPKMPYLPTQNTPESQWLEWK